MYKYLCPAKINLFLRINSQRKDGYHDLQSVFVPINIHDTLTVKLRVDSKINRISNFDMEFEEDLCIKALRAMQEIAPNHLTTGLDIELQKNIPMGAGLGGGSSNAASMLLALNQLWDLNLNNEQLALIALKLGADVPFFIYQQSSWVEGIGEKVIPCIVPKYYFIVIKPFNYISTKSIFTDSDLSKNSSYLDAKTYIEKINSMSIDQSIELFDSLGNSMQDVVTKQHPNIKEWLDLQNKQLKFNMTGSGSCFFAMFSSKEERDLNIENVLLPENWQYYLCESL